MSISLFKLRADLYPHCKSSLRSKHSYRNRKKWKKVGMVAVKKKSKLVNLTTHPGTIVGNPDDLIHHDWLSEWRKKTYNLF